MMKPYRINSASSVACLVVAALLCVQPTLLAAVVEGSFQRILQVSGAVNLDVTTGAGSIQVHTGNSNQVQVTGHIKATEWFGDAEAKVKRLEDNPPVQQSGNDIRVGHIGDADLRHNISISYEIAVPAETQLRAHSGSGNQRVEGISGPLQVDTGSGELKISDIGAHVHADTGSGSIIIDRVKGDVHAKAGSGSIRATEIAGGFEADTGSGHISLQQSAPGSVRAETGSGGVELHDVRGSLAAKAGSGTIRADGSPTGAWNVRTGSGTVQLKLPSDAAFDLNAHTSSGSISVDHPVTVQGAVGRKDVHGKVRGGGVPVEVETGSGNIEIH